MNDQTSIEKVYAQVLAYREDPVGFMREVLSVKPEYIWDKMVEVAEAVRDHQLVAVRAGHSVSKTYSLGRLAVWFKTCFQPSTVITTAPSDNQVRNQLWREIHAAVNAAQVPLGGQMHTLSWDVKPSKGVLDSLPPAEREKWQKNFAIGFSTSPDSSIEHATKMQGWHNEWVLVVIDEACGILPQIWRTVMESLIVDEQCKVIAAGNPTDPESDFAKACYSSDPVKNNGDTPYLSDQGWHVVTISSMHTPNYQQNSRVIPGLASRQYVERIIAKYGADGDGTRYRVMGLFPTHKEGTYYGRLLASARKESRIGHFPFVPTERVFTFTDTGDIYTATIFAQFIQGRIRLIDDYWDNEGQGLPTWVKMVQNKPYVYEGHYAGPDFNTSNAKSFQTGRTTKDVAADLGVRFIPCMRHLFDDGIEAVREVWPLLEINEPDCETFLKAAAGYGKKKNMALSTEEQTVYHDDPQKSWHRHMMDALRHLGVAYRYQIKRHGIRIGDEELRGLEEECDESYDPLTHF